MIQQPDFVNEEVVIKVYEIARKKKPNSLLKEVYFEKQEDGLSIQILHIGSYDNEPESFNKMKELAKK